MRCGTHWSDVTVVSINDEPVLLMASEFDGRKRRKSEEANIARGDSDDEPMLFMASESDERCLADWWYMDTGCSNHLIGNKQWLTDFYSRRRTKI